MSLTSIPEGFETPRLCVRSPRPGDGAAVFAAVAESLADLRAWPASLPWAVQEPSPSASEAFCLNGHRTFQEGSDMPMLIFLKGAHVLVGATGLHRLDWAVPQGEVGYWVRSACRHRGFITEAVTGLIQYARTHLHMRRLECRTDAQNTASRAVAERAGFVLEQTRPVPSAAPDGSSLNTCFYARAT